MMSDVREFKVLVAVDNSELSFQAVKWYLDHVYTANHYVIFMYVAEPLIPTPTMGSALMITDAVVADYLKRIKTTCSEIEERLNEFLSGKEIAHEFIQEEGDAGVKLCKTAKDHHTDLIVLGTRGMGRIRRTILGSVSTYVLHHADCAVNIYRQK